MKKTASAVEMFQQLAAEERFQGWPLVGEPELGPGIPFFGQTLNYHLQTGKGVEDYTSILRHFGWMVVFGVTTGGQVITLCQWKPGVNQASWELPPGGIGKLSEEATIDEIMAKTQADYLRETGYGEGQWSYLGHTLIETGKFRGAGPNSHGLKAHMAVATELIPLEAARDPLANEIMATVMVPVDEFPEVLASGLFLETSAVVCAYKALAQLGYLYWDPGF